MTRQPLLLAALAATVCLFGCDGGTDRRAPAKGKVSYKAQPVANKTLNLVFVTDQPADSFTHSLPLDAQGQFAGEVPKLGKYKVTIAESLSVMEGMDKPSKTGPKLPEKYKSAATSDITIEVGKSGYTGDIELKD